MPPNQFGNQGGANQFEILRRRAKREANVQTQQGQEALKRRFASIGQLNSGAAIKQQQIARQQGAERAERAAQTVDLAEAQENQRRKELIEGRQFQSGESQKQREFLTGERIGGQEFATGERIGGQEFVSGEADKARRTQVGLASIERSDQLAQNKLTNQMSSANLFQALGYDINNPADRERFAKFMPLVFPEFQDIKFDKDGVPIIS
jgi:hypothetical protein